MPRKPRSPITEEEKAEMVRLYVEEGYGKKAIAKMVLGNHGTATVRKVLKAAGVPQRSAEDGKKLSPAQKPGGRNFGRTKSRERVFEEERAKIHKRKKRASNLQALPLFQYGRKQYAKTSFRHKYQTDLDFRLFQVWRRRWRKVVTEEGTSKRAAEVLGCSVGYYRRYLESHFLPGMSWDNQGRVWHIDHVVPCKHFDHRELSDVRLCWNYRNTRPLWASENHKKSARIGDAIPWLYKQPADDINIELMRRALSCALMERRRGGVAAPRPRGS